jgi:hypothetical protein
MTFRHTTRMHTLIVLLLLAVGPLKAHAVYACEMMGVTMHDVCCCDEHEDPVNLDREVNPEQIAPDATPCCEQSAALSVDEETRQGSPIVKPPDLPSDLDPPDVAYIVVNAADIEPQYKARSAAYSAYAAPSRPGSSTWLSTRRLRI